ncbi:probable calcium-binding protein CML23 [Telopea speciosissima]|uniref:probable calcium-binding protein CML23 n=1 Tax=Telopea speciosissima TaxID=54955 RepID=UPI001CC467FA|nr:probable calcium-binding protein CML23 [Telopea speciosissima]
MKKNKALLTELGVAGRTEVGEVADPTMVVLEQRLEKLEVLEPSLEQWQVQQSGPTMVALPFFSSFLFGVDRLREQRSGHGGSRSRLGGRRVAAVQKFFDHFTSSPSENPSLKSSVYLDNMEEIKKVFKRFDVNGDDKISATELDNVLNVLGSETSPDEIKRMMAEIDTDGDGFIDLQEFADFHRGVNNGDARSTVDGMRELKDAFNLFDRDKNGLISVTELYSILKNLGENCSLHDCSKIISSFDADDDGNVNFVEFKKMMMTNSRASSH